MVVRQCAGMAERMMDMIKKIGYSIFAAFFAVFRLFPLREDKVFFVATHDDSGEGNAGIVADALRKGKPEMELCFLTRRDGVRHPFSFFIIKAYQMATSGTIFMDNEFMPMAYTPIDRRVKVVQLWHGTGSIKKIGLDVERGEVARLAAKANKKITHLIVNSELTKRQYARAFGVPEDRVHILGLPRTDLILDGECMEGKKREFYEQFPDLSDKRCVLYAPTFRDDEVASPRLALDLAGMLAVMADDEVLMLRLHPHVAANFSDEVLAPYGDSVVNMSSYRGVTTLLAVSDCLITDYSSIIYEYCLFDRPMIFYAYDLEKFCHSGRDFYEDYETYVPGPVAKDQAGLEELWKDGFPWKERVSAFRSQTYRFLDKNAVKRLLELIFVT